MGFKVDQAGVLAFAQGDIPFGSLDISGIHDLLEKPRDRHWPQRAVLTVFREEWVTFKKALHFRL
ncbi:hypothetical protein [Ruegeria arenilitoris]|uniref:hypothetical protein n=1 Tax=Ruegeria arenilitoris TaxID=1173585 RepID=UPI0020C3934A|nr:hypothetical protein [Ruegeria arenilitoris]